MVCQQRTLTPPNPWFYPFLTLFMLQCWEISLQNFTCFRSLSFKHPSLLLFYHKQIIVLKILLSDISHVTIRLGNINFCPPHFAKAGDILKTHSSVPLSVTKTLTWLISSEAFKIEHWYLAYIKDIPFLMVNILVYNCSPKTLQI